MTCKNCGAQISDNAVFCGICGFDTRTVQPPKNADDPDVTVSLFSTGNPSDIPENPVTVSNKNVDPEATVSYFSTGDGTSVSVNPNGGTAQGGAVQPDTTPAYNPYFDTNYSTPAEPPKKKRGKKALKIICIILAIVVVLGAVGYAFRDYLLNAYYSLRSPEIHQAYVYKKASEKLVDELTDPLFTMLGGYKDKTVSGEITVSADQQALELVGLGQLPVNRATVDFSFTNKNDMLALDLGANASVINLGAEARVDINKEKLTVDLPGISKSPLGLTFEEIEEMADMGDIKIAKVIEVLPEVIPEQEFVVDLAGTYVETALTSADKVTRDDKTLKVNGMSDEYTCFTTKVSEETANKSYLAVLEAIKEDEDIKDYILESCKSAEKVTKLKNIFGSDEISDGNDVYDEFIKMVDEEIDMAKGAETDDEVVAIVYTYINAKGEIMGIELEIPEEGMLRMAMLEDDTTVVLELSYCEEDADDPMFAILGKGDHIGNLFSGTFAINANGDQLATVETKNLDTDLLCEGYFKGKISAQLTKEGVELLDDEFRLENYEEIVSNLRFVIEGEALEENVDFKIALAMGGKEFVAIDVKGEIKEAEDVELHKSTTNDIDKWISDMDSSKLFSNPMDAAALINSLS